MSRRPVRAIDRATAEIAHLDYMETPRADARRDAPELGPRILFFTGGTALRPLSRVLKRHTFRSIHLVTPFDSGGSSAHLRRAFDMLSVGDLRNRLVALADESSESNPATYALLTYRLPTQVPGTELSAELGSLVDGSHSLMASISPRVRDVVQHQLGVFCAHMPEGFDLRGASLGNLVLTGGFLEMGRDIHAVIEVFSELLDVKGTVCPVTTQEADLAARLADGTRVVGQHLLTGKEVPPLESPIQDVWLDTGDEPRAVTACDRALELIGVADLVCYPVGSFFTSVAASLLPAGVGRALQANPCRKLYIPNTGVDPEQAGVSLPDRLATLLALLRRDVGSDAASRGLLDAVVLDRETLARGEPSDRARIEDMGVEVLELDLVTARSAPLLDPDRLASYLVSLC